MSNIFKKIDDKQNMLLEYNKDSNIYSLLFDINNKNNKNVNLLLDNSIYNLLKQLNSEIIYDVDTIVTENNLNIILFIFTEIGKELGLKQKYMFLHNIKEHKENTIYFKTESITKNELIEKQLLSNEILNKINSLQEIECKFANLTITLKENNIVNLHYLFNINLNENLPKHLENMIGLLMKKVFLNLKIFIEN